MDAILGLVPGCDKHGATISSALGVLPPSFADDPDRRARFEREAQAVTALSHPNIAKTLCGHREHPRHRPPAPPARLRLTLRPGRRQVNTNNVWS